MKCQILFSRKNKKNITNFSSPELGLRVVKVNFIYLKSGVYIVCFQSSKFLEASKLVRWTGSNFKPSNVMNAYRVRFGAKILKKKKKKIETYRYDIYSKYWHTFTPYHTCPILNLFHYLLMSLKYCWTTGKQCRP